MYKVKVNKTSVAVAPNEGAFIIDGTPVQWDCVRLSNHSFHLLYQNKSYRIQVDKIDYAHKVFSIKVNGLRYEVKAYNRIDLIAHKMNVDVEKVKKTSFVRAPMPGLIFDIKIKPGDRIKAGDPLLVLEAMKMENTLKAPYDGTVKKVRIKQGEGVEKNQILVEF